MWDPYAQFQSATLPNGLTIHATHLPDRPWTAIGFLIHSGAMHDPEGLEGLAHFIEHLVTENGPVNIKEMTAFFEDCGGTVDFGATGYSHSHYRLFIPIDKAILTTTFSIFGHILLKAKLEKCIEQERSVIVSEFYRQYPTQLKIDLEAHKHHALYPGSWLERLGQPLGNPESINRITQSELQSHYDAHYTPANISIVAVGGLTLPELVKLLSESPFATNKRGVRTPLPIPISNPTKPSEMRHVLEASRYGDVPILAGVYYSYAKIPGVVNPYTLSLLQMILNEILYEEVREKRAWCYATGSSIQNLHDLYELSVDCDGVAPEVLDNLETVIEDCLTSAANREDLLEQAKRRTIASNSMIDETAWDICAVGINDLVKHQRIIPLEEINNNYRLVTMKDIRDILHWLKPERRWTLIARP